MMMMMTKTLIMVMSMKMMGLGLHVLGERQLSPEPANQLPQRHWEREAKYISEPW